ncbi:hypothetical protein [Olivibacter jilunii]|uniref:hypothetical protein n=1 Tax=Olivibacter jilunii TaxID=985016 RepID=UPI001031BE32|nr:hypothetical protein [Olivibacter jilunii]
MNNVNRKADRIRRRAGRLLGFAVLTAVASATVTQTHAQTFGEFFSQKKTQKKYLLNQIAALQVYLGYVKSGINIASAGLETIKGFTKGEFNLHSAFIGSLKIASPFIRNNAKVAETIAMQLLIHKMLNGINGNGILSSDQQSYIGKVRDNVLDGCNRDLEELLLVITSGKVEMTEDERLNRLNRVYDSMRDRSAFVKYFTGEVSALRDQKNAELKSTNQIRNIYETDH